MDELVVWKRPRNVLWADLESTAIQFGGIRTRRHTRARQDRFARTIRARGINTVGRARLGDTRGIYGRRPLLARILPVGQRIDITMRDSYPYWSTVTNRVLGRPAVQRSLESEGVIIT